MDFTQIFKSAYQTICISPLDTVFSKETTVLQKTVAYIGIGILSILTLTVYLNFAFKYWEKKKVEDLGNKVEVTPEQQAMKETSEKIHATIQKGIKDGNLMQVKGALAEAKENGLQFSTLNGCNMLIDAIEQKNTEMAKLFIENLEHIDETARVGTPLEIASRRGNLDVVKILLDRHADINGSQFSSPLWFAAGGGGKAPDQYEPIQHEVIQYLLEKGADPSKGSPSVLALVAMRCPIDTAAQRTFQLLVEHKASLTRPDAYYLSQIQDGNTRNAVVELIKSSGVSVPDGFFNDIQACLLNL